MKMTFLQKVALSACISKGTWVVDQIMRTRMITARNQNVGKEDDTWIVVFQERSDREVEFKKMADELHSDMYNPDSALKLFLKNAPDVVEHLLNRCVVIMNKDQIQGKVFFDFFLFYPPKFSAQTIDPTKSELGELALLEVLIGARKERFLTHPVFETFLKLKWFRTWKLYLGILFMYAVFVVSVLGYALMHFGNVLDTRLDPTGINGWWYFLAVTTSYVTLIEICKIWYFCSHCLTCMREQWKRLKKDPWLMIYLSVGKTKDVSVPVLTFVVLAVDIDPEVRRYCAAVDVILCCFSFMLALSRLPKVGIYIFMLNKVFGTIFNFFVSYFWHFLGYAIAFHILMPGDEENGAFSSLGNSIIKVQ